MLSAVGTEAGDVLWKFCHLTVAKLESGVRDQELTGGTEAEQSLLDAQVSLLELSRCFPSVVDFSG